jgi:hypothetical protein
VSARVATQPLLVLGERRRAAVLARLRDGARRWRESWAPGAGESFEAQCETPAPGGFGGAVAAATTSIWSIERAGQRIAVLLLPHSTFAWCVQESGALATETGAEPAAGSIADQIEREVAESLLAQLCADGDAPLVARRAAADTLGEWSRETRAWSLQVRSGTSRSFTLLLDAAHVESLAPARGVGKGPAPRPRREAIGESALALRAIVGDASMSVSDLASLAIDDVLVLDHRLAEPVTLVARATGAPVAAGNLGRTGARRAIKVAAPASNNPVALKN